ncbi:MFS general substrate transporter [Calocera cornea HHB12733]|uniref:MFS general substrate transporter n=1 Tax=Calocera cornea HHB12733 TaxID=1353952 RepID=A0A165GNZ2_9BASI|nr:MFS general substrate transporter [Calocera cornea HHB12733]
MAKLDLPELSVEIDNALRSPTDSSKKAPSVEVCVVPETQAANISEKTLLRKLDWSLIPWLALLFFLSFLDRTSIGNAKLYNMETDLNITDNQYLIALTIFFIPYSLIETPSNILLKRLRPSLYLSWMMLLWGIMMTIQGLVKDYGGLVTMRFLLGFTEGGLFPGITYYLSIWYRREEFGIRLAFFFCAATVSGAFGGLIAAAISDMNGDGGKAAWAWIFLIQGFVTIVVGALSFLVLQDFPDTAKFITEEEREAVIQRLEQNDGFTVVGEKIQMKYVMQSFLDWKTWVGSIIYAGVEVPIYASALFTPSIINQLGYTATPANLLSVPVYVWACILCLSVGYTADRLRTRGIFNLPDKGAVGAAGYIILIFSRNAGLSYFGVYLGTVETDDVCRALVSNNVEGSLKRGVSLGIVIGLGNLNGIYRAQYQPWYTMSHGIVLLYVLLCFTGTAVMMVFLKRENDARDRGERSETIGMKGDGPENRNGTFETVGQAKLMKGDEWSGFRYTL